MPHGVCPPAQEQLTESAAELHVRKSGFPPGPPRRTGVELEWLLMDPNDPAQPVSPPRLAAAADAVRLLPLRSAVTVEPGGQLELSSPPAASLMRCVDAVDADLRLVRGRLRPLGLALAGYGLNPWQSPRRVVHSPRYAAMEAHFDRGGSAGRFMMAGTASTQICLDSGEREPGPLGQGRRWQLAHLLGAVLTATFANSPLQMGSPTGLRSTRQAVWAALDAGLAPERAFADPAAAWAAHALDAPVMFIRTRQAPWITPRGLTFREWLRGALPGLHPGLDDLDCHLSTLFPPVRPRGYLELRMIDAQPGADGWVVPLAVTATLFDDPAAAERAYRAVKQLAERAGTGPAPRNPLWRAAVRHGLADPELREVAEVCFRAALEALPRRGASPAVREAVARFADRYVARGRCPADDLLDTWKEQHP